MNTKNKLLTIGLTGCLTFITMITPVHGEDGLTEYTKSENVYAKLKANGKSTNAYVVNHFNVENTGRVIDYGEYTNIKNLSTLGAITNKNNQVEFDSDSGDFYYQGQMNHVELPWNFDIQYQLNGKNITSKELAGKEGKLKITFDSSKNQEQNNDFYDHYLMQISLTLDCSKIKNIVAEDATIADAGANKQLSFTVLPGNDAHFTIEGDIHNFTMSGFSIAAIPYAMNIDLDQFNMDDFSGQIDELINGVKQLNSGTQDLQNGLDSLCNGNGSLLDGSTKMQEGIKALSNNSSHLTEGSQQIKNALELITQQLSSADFSQLSNLQKLPDGLNQLASALEQIEVGLVQLRASYQNAYAYLDNSIVNNDINISEQELNTLKDSIQSDESLAIYQKLLSSYQQLQTIKGTYQKVKPAFDAVLNVLDEENDSSMTYGLKEISKNIHEISNSLSNASSTDIEKEMNTLKNGLSMLSSQYGEFHNGLISYTKGVDQISNSYSSLQNGISSYLGGTSQIKDGSVQLSKGMSQFARGISRMPDEIEKTINDMTNQYAGGSYQPTSFVDEKNKNISSVQFVLSTKGVEKVKKQEVKKSEKNQGFFERLKALFIKD